MRITSFASLSLAAVVLCLLPHTTLSVHAQAIEASIIGQVTDQSGLPLPGVTVTAASPVLQVREVSAVSDARGEYRLSNLPIGAYVVSYVLDGFQATKRENLRLTAGFTAKVDIALSLGSLNETITVTGASPIVDVTSSTTVTTLTRETLEVLPTSRDGMQAILVQAPGTRTNIDVGGNTMGDVPQFRLYGRDAQPWVVMEGVFTSSPTVRPSGQYQDYSMMEEVTVSTFAHDASVGAPGVALTTAVKSGGNTLHGDAVWSYTNDSLASNNVSAELIGRGIREAQPIFERWDFGGTVGGKVVRDKLWFVLAARQRVNDNGILGCVKGPTGGGRHPDIEQCENDTTTKYYNGKLSYQLNPSNRFVTYYQWNLKDTLGRDVSSVNRWTWRNRQYQTGDLFKAEWTHTIGSRGVVEVNYGYWDFGFVFSSFNPTTNTQTDIATRVQDGDRGTTTGLYARQQAHGKASWVVPTNRFGTHDLKAGWDLFWARIDGGSDVRQSGSYTLVFNNGVPFQLTVSNEPVENTNRSFYMPLYLHDQWRVTRRLTLNLGLRYSHDLLYIPEQSRVTGQFAAAEAFPRLEFAAWNWIVPRLHLAYDVTGDGKTVIKGGWARYAGLRDISIAQQTNRNGSISYTYRWSDLNGDKLYQPGEANLDVNGPGFVSQSGTNTQIPNPDEKPYIDDELSVSFEREVVGNLAVRVAGIYVRETNVPRLLNTLIPYDAYNIPITRPIPDETGVVPPGAPLGTMTYYEYPPALRGLQFQAPTIINDPRSARSWSTIELGLSKRLSSRWMAMSAFSATRTNEPFIPHFGQYGGFRRTDAVGTGALDPNQEINNANRTWEWTAKIGGSYQLPFGYLASTNYQILSGDKWGRTALFTGGVTIPSIVLRVEPIGTRAFPALHLLDARLEKNFTLFGTHRLGVRAEAFNLPNLSTLQSQIIQSGPTFGRPLSILPGRNVQFGLSYKF